MKSRQKKSNSPFGPERNRAGAAVFSPRTQACSSRRWQLGVPHDPRKAHDLHFIGPRRGLAGASGGALSKRPGERWLDPRKRSGSSPALAGPCSRPGAAGWSRGAPSGLLVPGTFSPTFPAVRGSQGSSWEAASSAADGCCLQGTGCSPWRTPRGAEPLSLEATRRGRQGAAWGTRVDWSRGGRR